MPEMDQFEYCYLAEETSPDATEMKIFVPKLMGNMSPGNKKSSKSVNTKALMNTSGDDGGDAGCSSSVSTQNYIVARVQDPYYHKHSFHDCPGNCPNTSHCNTCGSSSQLNVCHHFHHDHHFKHMGEKGNIPKGARLICCIMNHDINDIIVTRMLCEW